MTSNSTTIVDREIAHPSIEGVNFGTGPQPMTEQERDRLIEIHKPKFLRWTDWILDGDAVTYSGGGHGSASACRWLIPNTGHNRT